MGAGGDDFFRFANYAEAGLWALLGLGLALGGLRRRGDIRRSAWAGAVILVLFGLSDVVEAGTGAWWRPWWLLAWKAACIVALTALFVRHYRRCGPRGGGG